MSEETKITPQDIMDRLTSLAESMASLQTQFNEFKEKPEEKPEEKLEKISSEKAWKSLFE